MEKAVCGKRGLFITGRFKYRDLKMGSLAERGLHPSIGPGRNNERACGIIIINSCVLLVCCRKIAEQRGPRAATGSLLPQADFSGRFTIRDANRTSGTRERYV